MRYYRLGSGPGTGRLVARDGDDAYDITDADAGVETFADLAGRAADGDSGLDAVARRLRERAARVDVADLATPALPVAADEVWAAGVTYKVSEEAREEESTLPDMYVQVYDAERPEVFFKATPSRTVGPGEAVGIRGDSRWNVPEPELGVVLYEGEIVGYTAGNDMSSRDIEGENPLYLPQAKVYDRCCSLGPCVASPESVGDPHDLEMRVEIERDGDVVFEDRTSTAEMVRSCEELVSYLSRHNVLPETAVLLTGTSLVPPDSFSLAPDDRVAIEIESVGTLSNGVVEV